MASQEEIDQQQERLSLHRRNLAYYLSQQTQLGPAQTPVGTVNGIRDERANIKRIKGILRGWGQTVGDHPDDEAPAPQAAPTPQAEATSAKPAQPANEATKTTPKRSSRRKDQYIYDVFISYSSKDREWARGWLLPRLEAAGLRVCIDYRDFEIGLPILVNIEQAIEQSRRVLLILTPNWLQSQWTDFEALLIQTDNPSARQRRMQPLILQPCQPPARLALLTAADFTKPEEWEWELSRLIKSLSQTQDASAPPKPPNTGPRDAAPATASTKQLPTTQIGRDQANVQNSPGAITGGVGGSVEQNFGAQNTTNAGTVVYIQGGNFQGANLGIGNMVAGNLTMNANPSKDEFLAALRQLKDELAKANDLPPDEAADLKTNLNDAIEAAERTQPNKERAVRKLTAMKELVDGLKDNVGSALALGHLIGQIVQAAQRLVF
jgi:hypothetical protein